MMDFVLTAYLGFLCGLAGGLLFVFCEETATGARFLDWLERAIGK